MNNRKKTTKNFVYSLLGFVLTMVIGIILPRLYIVSFGSEINGMLSSLQQFLVYLGLFEAGIGATTLQALYAPVAEKKTDEINGILSATNNYYKKTAILYGGALLLLAIIYPLITKSQLPYGLVFLCVLLIGSGNVVLYYVHAKYKILLQADGKYYICANVSTVISLTASFSRIIIIALGGSILVVLSVSAVIQILPAWYIVCYVKRNYPQLNLKVPPLNERISQKNYMLLHQVAGLIFQNTDVLILSIVCGLKVVSVYSVYRLVIAQIESLIQIPMNSVGFLLGQTYQTNRRLYTVRIDLFERWYSALAFSLYAIVLSLFTPFISLYTKGVTDITYLDSWLPILFVSVALLTAMRTPMLNTINYAGKFKETLPRSLTETGINLVVTIVGVFLWGIYGALIGTIAALLYRTLDVILYANKTLLGRGPFTTLSIYFEDILLFGISMFIFRFLPKPTSYISFCFAGMIRIGITCGVFGVAHLALSKETRIVLKNIARKASE